VGRLHDARPAAGHDGEPRAREPSADIARHAVIFMIVAEARRAEDRDARADEVERAEAAHELEENFDRADELAAPLLRSVEKANLLVRAGRFAPAGFGDFSIVVGCEAARKKIFESHHSSSRRSSWFGSAT